MIEDDPSFASFVKRALERDGHQAEVAAGGNDGLRRLTESDFDLVITALRLKDLDGFNVVQRLGESKSLIPVILMTGFGTTDISIKAMQLGAVDFLSKPFQVADLQTAVKSALANRRPAEEPVILDQHKGQKYEIIGRSRAMQAVFKQISRLAPSKLAVLIQGETGTGKELVAQALHQYSDRSGHPFVAVNCMAVPETLIESELFGHERGAFTGAVAQRIGWFERANQGTLFLDEVGDVSLQTQAKLLRVIQDKKIQRLGGQASLSVDVRIVTATNRDLVAAVREKAFREDLYFRLSGAIVTLPPLRERKEDILSLVSHFVKRHNTETGAEKLTISLAALQLLEQQDWPGNVRQLENAVYRALLLARNNFVSCDAVREALDQATPSQAEETSALETRIGRLLDAAERDGKEDVYADLIEMVERELYRQAHDRAKGKQSKIVQWLGVSRPTVHQKLQQFGWLP